MKSRLRHLLEVALSKVEDPEREVTLDGRMTHARAAVLGAIVRVGRKFGVSGVARSLSVSQPLASQAIGDLERMGLLVRVQRVGSAVHSILLSEEGAAALSALDSFHGYVEDSALEPLNAIEKQAFLVLLIKLAQFEEVDEVRSGSTCESEESDSGSPETDGNLRAAAEG